MLKFHMIDLNKHFDAFYVLTDRKFVSRHEFVKLEYPKLSLPFVFHYDDVVRGCSEYPLIRRILPGSYLGEVGCALTHYTCWEKCQSACHNSVLFLEDDVEINDGACQIISDVMSNLPSDWTVVYLGVNTSTRRCKHSGSLGVRVTVPIDGSISVDQTIKDRNAINQYVAMGQPNTYSPLGGTWAYALSSRGIDLLVRRFKPDNKKLIIHAMIYKKLVKEESGGSYVAIPQAFRHAGLAGEIHRHKMKMI